MSKVITVLRLPLKTKWFWLTKSEIKIEDYREINMYWFKRLVFQPKKCIEYLGLKNDHDILMAFKDNFWSSTIAFNPFETNVMTLGYPSNDNISHILKFEHAGIEVRPGNPDWGAEPNKLYFVIKHGNKIHTP